MSTDGTYSMDLMAERAKIRMDQTKATNPNFYYGPVTGMLARNAGYLFVGRVFPNHTEENPDGVLSMSNNLELLRFARGWLTVRVQQPRTS